ncbi:MAG: heme exporter protein CcmB [Betaproteobacteria bacterium]|jgi:heme exporter protein B|nr:heme exporter protein CcmB [Betaproteobacteria bacterium]MDH4294418.1 heme exporter protein CcmB [Betaproteobacteria bacterium]MDH5343637.1 heme exporter protein CcmB [Betaproteobacteria bacterium]
MGALLRAVIRRDLLLAWRRRSDVATVVLFFIIVVSLFPLGVGPEPDLLRKIAPGIIWVAALLACMLSLQHMFASDHADGALDQMLLAAAPLGMIVAARAFAHWLISGLPLVILSPILAIQFDLSPELSPVLTLSLLLGTPILTLIGAIGAALTLGLRGGGMLLALLVLPLYIPVLILGAGAVDAASAGLGADAHLLLLAAQLILTGTFAPWAVSAALRISAE